MSSAVPKEKGMREYQKTGLFTLKRALIDFGSKAIDGRSSVGVALRRWGRERHAIGRSHCGRQQRLVLPQQDRLLVDDVSE